MVLHMPGPGARAWRVRVALARRSLMGSEELQERVGRLCSDHAHQLFPSGAADPGEAPEPRQQHLSAPRPNPRHVVELGSQIPAGPRLPMKADGEAMRLIAYALQQPQRRSVRIHGDRLITVACENELLLLRQADGD